MMLVWIKGVGEWEFDIYKFGLPSLQVAVVHTRQIYA